MTEDRDRMIAMVDSRTTQRMLMDAMTRKQECKEYSLSSLGLTSCVCEGTPIALTPSSVDFLGHSQSLFLDYSDVFLSSP